MAKEQLTKAEELHRIGVALDSAQHRHSTVLRRLEEVKKELDENIVHNEIHGYRSSTIERNRKEIKELTDEAEKLSFSIAAMQKQLPVLQQEAGIERFHEDVVILKELAGKLGASAQELLGGLSDISFNKLLDRISSLSDEIGIFKSKLKDAFSAATRLHLPLAGIQTIERCFREEISPLFSELEDFSAKLKDAIFELQYVFSR